jgi:hypothetical protein
MGEDVLDQFAGVLEPLRFCGVACSVELSGCTMQRALNTKPVLTREGDGNDLGWCGHVISCLVWRRNTL